MNTKWILFFLLAGSFLVGGDHRRVRGWDSIKSLDTNEDGQINKEEFTARAGAHFDKMDVNGDGVLNEDEVPGRGEHRVSGKRGESRRRRGAGRMTLLADVDKSGDVTGEEWATFISAISAEDGLNVDPEKLMALLPDRGDRGMREGGRPQIALADLQSRFDQMDQNDDGQLSEDELPKMRGRRGKSGALGGLLLIKAADSDDEPGISGKEWATFIDGLEVDEAGVVDPEVLASRISEAYDVMNERTPPLIGFWTVMATAAWRSRTFRPFSQKWTGMATAPSARMN